MRKHAMIGAVAATVFTGFIATGHAQDAHSTRNLDQTKGSHMAPQRDFEALAPAESNPSRGEDRDPYNYNLGYFRNF